MMAYQFEFEQPPSSVDGNSKGGLVRSGGFGLDRPIEQPILLEYARRVNPNFVISMGAVVATVVALSSVAGAWQKASIQKIEAETKLAATQAQAEQKRVEHQSKLMDKLASASSQRPVCLGLVVKTCGAESAPPVQQASTAPVIQFSPDVPFNPFEGSDPIPNATPAASPVATQSPVQTAQSIDPNNPQSVGYWQYFMQTGNYQLIEQWDQYCASIGDAQSECTALRQALQSPAV